MKLFAAILKGIYKIIMTILTPFMPALKVFQRLFEHAVKLEFKTDAGKVNFACGAFVVFLIILVLVGQGLYAVYSLFFKDTDNSISLTEIIIWPFAYGLVCLGVVAIAETKSNTSR